MLRSLRNDNLFKLFMIKYTINAKLLNYERKRNAETIYDKRY